MIVLLQMTVTLLGCVVDISSASSSNKRRGTDVIGVELQVMMDL